MRRIIILLPAYNEETSIRKLLDAFADHLAGAGLEYKFVICNDGSADSTCSIIEDMMEKYPIDLITHTRNRGLGETIRDLVEHAYDIGREGDVIMRMDCDNTHSPDFALEMVRKLDEGNDVVIASRFQPGGGQYGVNGYRAFISQMANLFMKFFFPIPGVREYSCGYRAYRYEIVKRAIDTFGNDFIQLKGLGFTCTLEKIVKLRLLGARFAEIPFTLRYDMKESSSKMIGSITTLGYFLLVVLYYWPWGGWRSIWKEKL